MLGKLLDLIKVTNKKQVDFSEIDKHAIKSYKAIHRKTSGYLKETKNETFIGEDGKEYTMINHKPNFDSNVDILEELELE
jgi:hypothetical protein